MIRRALESGWVLAINLIVAGAILLSFLPVRLVIAPAPGAWCVSAAGALHGPESPYRAMVPVSRCHPTRAAAEAALTQE